MLAPTSVAGSCFYLETMPISSTSANSHFYSSKSLSGNNPNQASFIPLFLPHASEVFLVPDLHNPRRLPVHLSLHLLHVLGHLVHELRLVRPKDADGEERRVGGVVDANRRDRNTALEQVSTKNRNW